MKIPKSLLAGLVIATASLGSSAAWAVDISSPPEPLNLIGNTTTGFSAFFGDSFNAGNASNTFADHFTFTVSGAVPWYFDGIVSSISRTADVGLDITGLSLYNAGGTQLATGSSLQDGEIDVWTLSSDGLMAGSYYVQVSGTVVGATSGSFGGAVMLAPVPEPETYAMMLAGLGLVGFMTMRRRSK